MNKVIIFGKPVTVIIKNSKRDAVKLRQENKLLVYSHKKPATLLVKEFLSKILYNELHRIYEQVKKSDKVDITRDLDFDIVDEIDGKRDRLAKLKGNTILIKLEVIKLPKRAVKYIVCHEIAHIAIKRHTRKFWELLEIIYPNYKIGEKLMIKYKAQICRCDEL